MKRDVLTLLDGFAKRGGPPRTEMERPAPEISVLPDVEPFEEPTWEVRQPGSRRRCDARTRCILSVAAAAAVLVNAGAAWAYWKVNGSGTASVRAGTAVHLTLRGRSDLGKPLTPGDVGNLTVTVANDNDFPIRITSVEPAPGNIVADDEHRDAGCLNTGVTMTRDSFAVSWDVVRNNIGAFTVPDGLRMAGDVDRACLGATFTVTLRASGVSKH